MTKWLSNRRAQSGRGICEGCDLFSFLEHDPDKVGVGTGGGFRGHVFSWEGQEALTLSPSALAPTINSVSRGSQHF